MTSSRTWYAVLLFAALPAFAQYQTPTVDGTVSPGEYAHSSGKWSMTWDATYLYVGVSPISGLKKSTMVYLDTDPLSIPSGGTNSSGNLTGITEYSTTPSLPFRADVRAIRRSDRSFGLQTRDGSGSWSAEDTDANDITGAYNGVSGIEMRIRWGAIPGLSGVPSSFHWLGVLFDTDSFFFLDPMPSGNPTGTVSAPSERYFFSVASTADGSSTDPFSVQQSTWSVSSNADSGTNTLRDAITNANADTTSSRRYIVFGSINSNTITTTTNLPAITQTTTLDGTTAPGYSSTPVLVLHGFNMTSDLGIQFSSASNCVVRGFVLQNHVVGVKITNGSSNTVAGNYFGTNTAGDTASSNAAGISINDCSGCIVGGTTVSDRNLISSNSSNGVSLSSASSTVIKGNYFGVK